MQQLYLSDLGNMNPNVASDVTTQSLDVQIEANKGDSTQTLSPKKGKIADMGEPCVPHTPSDDGDDEDAQKIKLAEDALNLLSESISGAKDVPDASASLAHDQPQDAADDVVDNLNVEQDKVATADVTGNPNIQPDDGVTDTPIQQKEAVTGDTNTDNVMSENLDYVTADEDESANKDASTEDDVTIMKIVDDSRKKAGKAGVGSRLRVRKEKVTEIVAEEPKSTKKKKNVAAEATTSPKKKKVATEASTSTKKKKMYGPVRRSSRVEIPTKQ
jgi:hypothetical protein